MRDALDSGVLAGYPLVDLRATLVDGSAHSVDSNEMAFRIAGSMALQAAAKAAGVKLLEPIMEVEVVTPEDYMGEVIGDLSSRRGKIESMDSPGQHAGGEGADPAGRDVRVRHRRPLAHPGPGHLHHAVPLLPGSAHGHRRGDRRKVHGHPAALTSTRPAASTSRCASTSASSTSSIPTPKTVDALMRLDLPAGVEVEIKT